MPGSRADGSRSIRSGGVWATCNPSWPDWKPIRGRASTALQANAEYGACRREHGERAARATGLGHAVSYRFKRDDTGWRVLATTDMAEVPVAADRRHGVIGVDLNAGHLAVAEADASGNYTNSWRVPLVTCGKSQRQAEAIIGDAVGRVG